MTPAQQAHLFTPDTADAATQASDRELLSDVYEAAAILGMGDDGIGAHTAARLRGELLAAVRELARRWRTTETET